ncbi:hypothetical protein HKX48_001071 [Thoreauomyces humboldtii]|nr:hypothetical protein HKX48_001071 [Thoreauomyces humboldtii]
MASDLESSPEPSALRKSMSPVKEKEVVPIKDLLQRFQDAEGRLDATHVQAFAKLAAAQTDWNDRKDILAYLVEAQDPKVFKGFLRYQGLITMTKILLQAKDSIDVAEVTPVALQALELLLVLPVDVADLLEVKTGRVVKHYANGATIPTNLQDVAKKVMASWQLLAVQTSKESTSPTTDTPPSAPTQKREREEDQKIETVNKKAKGSVKAPPSPDRKDAMELSEPPFKPLPAAELPKIKKIEPAHVKSTPAVLAAKSPPPALPMPLPVPPVPSSIPSYRAKPSETLTPTADVVPAKRRVRFAEGDKLVQIRFFEKDIPSTEDKESNDFNVTPHLLGSARDLDLQEGKQVFKRKIKPGKEWSIPTVMTADVKYEWGNNSTEGPKQDEAARTQLGANYFSETQIPASASEPAEEVTGDATPPRNILWEAPLAAVPIGALATAPPDMSTLLNSLLASTQPGLPADASSLLNALLQAQAQPAAPAMPDISALLALAQAQQQQQQQQNPPPTSTPTYPGAMQQNYNQQSSYGGAGAAYPANQGQTQQDASGQRQFGVSNSGPQPRQANRTSRWDNNSNAPVAAMSGPYPFQNQAQMQNQNQHQNNHPNAHQNAGFNHQARGGYNGGGRGAGGGAMGNRPGPYDRPPMQAGAGRGRGGGPVSNVTHLYGTVECKYFRFGNCRYGDKCTFRHTMPDQM